MTKEWVGDGSIGVEEDKDWRNKDSLPPVRYYQEIQPFHYDQEFGMDSKK